MISLEEMGLIASDVLQESPSQKSKRELNATKAGTPPKKSQKAKLNERVKNKIEEKSLKIRNREKTPLKKKNNGAKQSPTRDPDSSSEEYESSSMHQRSPSMDEETLQRSSPMKAYVLQGSPVREGRIRRDSGKKSPINSPVNSPSKQSPVKKNQVDPYSEPNDSQVVNNIFLSNISPPSQKVAHTVSVLPGKRAPKKYSPQKNQVEEGSRSQSKQKAGSPQKESKAASPSKLKQSPSKQTEPMAQEQPIKRRSPTKNAIESPQKSSPSKRRLEFSEEKENTPPKARKLPEEDVEIQNNSQKSPKRGLGRKKESPSKQETENNEPEEEGIDLLELINLSIGRGNNSLDELEDYDLEMNEFDMSEFDELPAYTLFEDDEDKLNYFNELNSRYFEEIDKGKVTPKRKDYDYKKVAFGKKKKIKSRLNLPDFFKEDRCDAFMKHPLEIEKLR